MRTARRLLHVLRSPNERKHRGHRSKGSVRLPGLTPPLSADMLEPKYDMLRTESDPFPLPALLPFPFRSPFRSARTYNI